MSVAHEQFRIRRAGAVLGGLFLLATVATAPAAGPSRSDALMTTGGDALSAGRYQQALDSFEAAAAEDPTDSEPLFFAGVALNRLGRPGEALSRLQAARTAGSAQPDLPFETGWALLMMNRWQEAIDPLTRYDAVHPDRGQTMEFLGAAYLALGRRNEAQKAFDEAIRREPDNADLRRAIADYQNVLAPQAVTAAGTPATSGTPAVSAGASPWSLSVSVGDGYDSNPRGLGDLFPDQGAYTALSQGPERASPFESFSLSAGRSLIRTPVGGIAVDYQLRSDTYARSDTQADLLDQRIGIDGSRKISEALSISAGISDSYTMLYERFYRDQVEGRGALDWQVARSLVTEASLTVGYGDYLKTTHRTDASGLTSTVALTARWQVPGTILQCRAGGYLVDSRTIGQDFDYGGNGLLVGITTPLPWKITADLGFTSERDEYQHPNSAANLTRKRNDTINILSLRLVRPITDHLSAYVDYSYTSDNANIKFYHYDQNVLSAGFTWKF